MWPERTFLPHYKFDAWHYDCVINAFKNGQPRHQLKCKQIDNYE